MRASFLSGVGRRKKVRGAPVASGPLTLLAVGALLMSAPTRFIRVGVQQPPIDRRLKLQLQSRWLRPRHARLHTGPPTGLTTPSDPHYGALLLNILRHHVLPQYVGGLRRRARLDLEFGRLLGPEPGHLQNVRLPAISFPYRSTQY